MTDEELGISTPISVSACAQVGQANNGPLPLESLVSPVYR